MEKLIITILILGGAYYLLTREVKPAQKPLMNNQSTQTSFARGNSNPEELTLLEEIITQIKDLSKLC